MSDIPLEIAQVMLEEPEPIVIGLNVATRKNGARYNAAAGVYKLNIPGFTVVGTTKLFAVYRVAVATERWGLVHVPTGVTVYAKFRIREEAEDFASWLWLNALNRNGLTSTNSREVAEALGPRVRSRGIALTLPQRAARALAVGSVDDSTPMEQQLKTCMQELRTRITTATENETACILSITQKERAMAKDLAAAEKLTKELAERDRILASETAELEATELNLERRKREALADQQELNLKQINLIRIRDDLARAIRTCIPTDEEPVIQRALRGVRFRNDSPEF